ncbi:MAG: NADPH:quinone oxidoreductase family protein [Ilumatobacteraceae bacterium]
MRAVLCSEFAPLDRLQVVERESPPCGPGQVRIAVTAAGVNFVDALIVQGLYQLKPRLPFVPGGEIAGTISEVGDGVTTHRVGDRVFASSGLAGGFATEAVVAAAAAVHTPDELTDTQAATFVQSYMTARFALDARARAQAGQWLLVLGAGGGVGLGAVDVGSAMGLHVIAAASSDAKRATALAHGAAAVIDTTTEDAKVRARELAGGDGVDLVYDPVGGTAGEQALRALRDDGQFLVIGFASGDIPKLPANQVLLRNRRVTGVDWGGWAVRHQEENRAILDSLVADIRAGKLHPVEPATVPLSRAADALRDQQERRVTGKTALVPD